MIIVEYLCDICIYCTRMVRFELRLRASIVPMDLKMQVAAIGMDPHKHLGKDLASLQPHLTRLGRYVSSGCTF